MHPVHILSRCLRYILILYSPLNLDLESHPFPSGLWNKDLYAFLSFTMRATSPAYLILLDIIVINGAALSRHSAV